MKTAYSVVLGVVVAIFASHAHHMVAIAADATADCAPGDDEPAKTATPKAPATIKPLSDEQLTKLLGARLSGGMGNSFKQFANLFLVSSRINLGVGIGLMTSSEAIADAPLQSAFPESYEPTLREFLDAIALQTFSEWKYDISGKYLESDVDRKPIADLAIFEFTKTDRKKPYEVTLADGWKADDRGNWTAHRPPNFPVGMDIYEMGTYSAKDKAAEKDFFTNVREDVALEWANRVSKDVAAKDLKPGKVGVYDALYFEAMIPTRINKDIKWRQWVFMVDNRCFFVVSTILPDLDTKIYPDVEKMLASFRMKGK